MNYCINRFKLALTSVDSVDLYQRDLAPVDAIDLYQRDLAPVDSVDLYQRDLTLADSVGLYQRDSRCLRKLTWQSESQDSALNLSPLLRTRFSKQDIPERANCSLSCCTHLNSIQYNTVQYSIVYSKVQYSTYKRSNITSVNMWEIKSEL